jgi:hypothetical protein
MESSAAVPSEIQDKDQQKFGEYKITIKKNGV